VIAQLGYDLRLHIMQLCMRDRVGIAYFLQADRAHCSIILPNIDNMQLSVLSVICTLDLF